MSFTRKFGMSLATVGLVAGSFAIGVAGAESAVAKPTTHCTLDSGSNYPPAQCYIVFNKGTYGKGSTVKFSGHHFAAPGITVTKHLRCNNGKFHTALGTVVTNKHDLANGSFTLPAGAPSGHCSLVLINAGTTILDGFTVKA
ncbi:MAG TPA: hypothetical protein VHW74_09745 [Mycobacteriales bacterium]|jgi:hypothetical protein|nr:hypothetical protein [Mycobacteriales bacterium]